MTTDEIITSEIEACERVIENARLMRRTLHILVPVLNALPSLRFCYYYPHSASIILGVHTRADLATVRALHHGVWSKMPPLSDDENVRYEATVMGILIDIRVSELPPSCCIVEEHKIIPEHAVTIRRLVCNDPDKSAAAQPDKIISIETVPEEVPAF